MHYPGQVLHPLSTQLKCTDAKLGDQSSGTRHYIGALLFPLRFDIIYRSGFLGFFDEHEADYGSEQFMDQALKMGIARWQWLSYNASRYVCGKSLIEDTEVYDERCETLARESISKVVNVYRSLREHGFREDLKPLLLRVPTGKGTTIGLTVPSMIALAGGQHRMMAMYHLGMHEFSPMWATHRIMSKEYHPMDTTHLFILHGMLPEKDFVDFARLRYPFIHPRADTIDEMLRLLNRPMPSWFYEYIDFYKENYGKLSVD